MSDLLILVDKKDKIKGYKEKEPCHTHPTVLHRAFSIFIFNSGGKMLIHKRAGGKKTWPNFWTNSCCSHPRKGETTQQAANRRLKEELGINCKLKYLFKFCYKAKYDSKYGEYELDHVFVSRCNKKPKINRREIASIKYVSVPALMKDVKKNPKKYTPWFKIALPKVVAYAKKHNLSE